MKNMLLVAQRMNNLPKVVFSRPLDKALRSNTKLPLNLKKTRTFGDGNVLLFYEPMA